MNNLRRNQEIAWISYIFFALLFVIFLLFIKANPHLLFGIFALISLFLWIFSIYAITITTFIYETNESRIIERFCKKNRISNLSNLFINSREENIRIEECASRELARLEKFRNDYSLITLISFVCSCITLASFYLTFSGSNFIPIPIVNSKNWLSVVQELLALSAGLSPFFVFLLSRGTSAERTYRRLVLRVRENLNH